MQEPYHDNGNVYVAGITASVNVPTSSPLQANMSGATDFFIAKIRASSDLWVTISDSIDPADVDSDFNYTVIIMPDVNASQTITNTVDVTANEPDPDIPIPATISIRNRQSSLPQPGRAGSAIPVAVVTGWYCYCCYTASSTSTSRLQTGNNADNHRLEQVGIFSVPFPACIHPPVA